ncbi:uncharacterized protein LY89DRAFT_666334 [Mollisia scopiformis]|uniref:Uncharacterized protein n=1 Tax=Mollisia scopiformis TaxID=149040 RepID=A0A194XKE7_MOLSC|nr:uncharacterized protein LY89DRAFT_666334 [Mollisia scopiformis]KUJ20685.1 hypothetical protein LY89DRAFT_666334 [Mollisia scopiformis]
MPNPFTIFIEKLSRAATKTWKQIKRVFKNKQPSDPFLRTVKIFSSHANGYVEFKMRLDTGCEIHNLITLQAVHKLHLFDNTTIHNESICTCLNGEQLMSMGTLILRWKGKRFRKIFTTIFHVINGDSLPWDVILGAEAIREYSILKFAGFGGARPILPKKSREKKAYLTTRKREHNEKAATNDAKVDADIKAKEEAARQTKSNTDGFSSGSPGVNRS